MRLLIAVHSSSSKHILRGMRECGHVVDHAPDGAAALEFALCSTHDVIVLDGDLPPLGGLALISRLRQSAIGAPVLGLLPGTSSQERVAAIQGGCDTVVERPY